MNQGDGDLFKWLRDLAAAGTATIHGNQRNLSWVRVPGHHLGLPTEIFLQHRGGFQNMLTIALPSKEIWFPWYQERHSADFPQLLHWEHHRVFHCLSVLRHAVYVTVVFLLLSVVLTGSVCFRNAVLGQIKFFWTKLFTFLMFPAQMTEL